MSRYLRPAVFVPELKRSEDLFREMRRRRFHMAVVVDESGAVAGLVTLEDLIEQIVGDIFDEHDEPAGRPERDGTSLLVEGAYPLTSLERDLGASFDDPDDETVAGFLLRKFGRIPRAGARTREGDLEFLVERASPRAIERIRILRVPAAPPAVPADARKASNDVTAPPRVVTLIPGDGIGPEITAAVTTILEAAGAGLAWERHDAGAASIKASGMPLPPATLASIRRKKVALKGPITTPDRHGLPVAST